MLSFAEIGPACMLSRAVGGLIGAMALMVMPGSRAAVSCHVQDHPPRTAPHRPGGKEVFSAGGLHSRSICDCRLQA